MMGVETIQIGEAARRTGISIDAIRFYEKAGLLSQPARTKSGYRIYQQRELADLEFIQKAQQLGFSLKEIHELFSIQRHPQERCEHVRNLIAQKLAVVRNKLQELQMLESGLADALKQCRKAARHSAKHPDCCPVLQEIGTALPGRKKA
jgi:DNA-binding transcriptional MerR regulator